MLWLLAVTAAPCAAQPFDWQDACRPFIAPAEQYYKLPAGLVAAIAVVESGRHGIPYPWALNIAGDAVIAPDYASAAKLLRTADGAARRDIAIGCMQIHMHYHLASFHEPEWALHPRYNVWYGARFLQSLYLQYGNWPAAIAHYHGSDPTAQSNYLCRVAQVLNTSLPSTRRRLGLPLCGRTPAIPSPTPEEEATRQAIMSARRSAPMVLQRGAP